MTFNRTLIQLKSVSDCSSHDSVCLLNHARFNFVCRGLLIWRRVPCYGRNRLLRNESTTIYSGFVKFSFGSLKEIERKINNCNHKRWSGKVKDFLRGVRLFLGSQMSNHSPPKNLRSRKGSYAMKRYQAILSHDENNRFLDSRVSWKPFILKRPLRVLIRVIIYFFIILHDFRNFIVTHVFYLWFILFYCWLACEFMAALDCM